MADSGTPNTPPLPRGHRGIKRGTIWIPVLVKNLCAAACQYLRNYWSAPRHKAKWTEGATVILTLLTAAAAFWSAWIFQGQLTEMRIQREDAERPWVAFELSREDGNNTKANFFEDEGNGARVHDFAWLDSGKEANVILDFRLLNSGKSPARVEIYGHIEQRAENVEEPNWDGLAMEECTGGRRQFDSYPRIWTVLPSAPMEYQIRSDGSKWQMPKAVIRYPITKNILRLTVVGCIVYRATDAPSSKCPSVTPFITHFTVGMTKAGDGVGFDKSMTGVQQTLIKGEPD